MPAEQREAVRRLAHDVPEVTVLDSYDSMVSLMEAADVVVSMAGYNTMCEVLTTSTPAVVAPRIEPAAEQLIRARCLDELGVVTRVGSAPTPAEVHAAVARALSTPPVPAEPRIDLRGGERIEKHLGALLGDG